MKQIAQRVFCIHNIFLNHHSSWKYLTKNVVSQSVLARKLRNTIFINFLGLQKYILANLSMAEIVWLRARFTSLKRLTIRSFDEMSMKQEMRRGGEQLHLKWCIQVRLVLIKKQNRNFRATTSFFDIKNLGELLRKYWSFPVLQKMKKTLSFLYCYAAVIADAVASLKLELNETGARNIRKRERPLRCVTQIWDVLKKTSKPVRKAKLHHERAHGVSRHNYQLQRRIFKIATTRSERKRLYDKVRTWKLSWVMNSSELKKIG